MNAAADPIPRRQPAPAWKLWANPIIRRYARSRLRPQSFGIWLIIVLLIAGFIFFLGRSVAHYQANLEMFDAERAPLIPLFILQGVILFLLGTGQVAGGMTAEGDEGVLDYQRLAPMSPLAKVLGYLFGLPIREYLLCLATFPFTLWCLWKGGVRLDIAGQLYVTFFSSALLYHLTGLVSGTVVKNRRWAFLVSMIIVFLLYTVIPQLAKFGLVYFRYFTVYPVFEDYLPYLLPQKAGAIVETYSRLLPQARFFNIDLPQTVFTLVSQAMLVLTGIVMVWRRWHRHESHLLGKVWAVGLFAWTQILLLGNALPLIEGGRVFPSREFGKRLAAFQTGGWEPDRMEAVAMSGIFALVTLTLIMITTLMITPTRDTQIRGWRRARKLGNSRLPFFSDPATGFWAVLTMVVCGTIGWSIFTKAIVESHWFAGALPWSTYVAFALTLASGGLGFHAILEGQGGRQATLTVIFVGVVPIMLGIVIASTNDRFAPAATWITAMSPASGTLFAPGTTLPLADLPMEIAKAMPRAFWFCQCLFLLVSLWLIARLVRQRKDVAESTIDQPTPGKNPPSEDQAPSPPATSPEAETQTTGPSPAE
ncbi:MAG: hypothetical protein AAF514_10550 [Verrucomicrobiota bacterium]